jgi:DNA-binding response OmpR family regulator
MDSDGRRIDTRIFLLEDDDNLRELIEKLLARAGREVIAAREPLLCPVYLDGRCDCPPGMVCGDILISDIQMPRMDGLSFIANQIAKGCRGLSRNKAVFSGRLSAADCVRAADLGCEVFRKPSGLDQLLHWVDRRAAMIDPQRRLRPLDRRRRLWSVG